MAMNVRPWKPPPNAMTPLRPVCARAILIVFSTASAPVVTKIAFFGVEPGAQPVELLGELHRRLVGRDHQARVAEPLELPSHGRLHLRMQVPGVEYRDAGREIDVPASLDVPDLCVARAVDVNGQHGSESAGERCVTTTLQVQVALGHCKRSATNFFR
jgi:hypothetical protein